MRRVVGKQGQHFSTYAILPNFRSTTLEKPNQTNEISKKDCWLEADSAVHFLQLLVGWKNSCEVVMIWNHPGWKNQRIDGNQIPGTSKLNLAQNPPKN